MHPSHWIHTLPLRLRALFRRRRLEQDLDEELRYHLECQIEHNLARGMSPETARREAQLSLGGLERRKEECRDTRRVSLVEHLLRDLRYAARSLGRNPGHSLIVVLTLALGIGATTAIFTVANGVLFRPLGYQDPTRLVVIKPERGATVSPANFLDWQATSRSFEAMGLAEYWTPTLTGEDRPEGLLGLHLSADLLPLLGVAPELGRVFLPEEEHAGRDRVVVLRHDFWQSRFGGDSSVVGRSLRLDGEPYRIIGVMPRGFGFAPFWATGAQFWAPLVLDARRADRGGSSLRAFARLRPDVSLTQAREEMAVITAGLEREFPGTNREISVYSLREIVVEDVETALLLLLGAVGLVLLIACANVAHLQLTRAAAREREFNLRTALGASRGRLAQQSLVESGLLSLVGALVGLGLAWMGVRLLIGLAPAGLPRLDAIHIDGKVLGFTLAVSAFAGLIFGLAPALAASSTNPHGALQGAGRSVTDTRAGRRLRAGLVVSEFALALMLLAGAGLLIRSFAALLTAEAGYDPSNVLSLQVSLTGTHASAPERRLAFFRELVDRVRSTPGVTSVGAINHVPLVGDNWFFPFAVEGRPLAPPGEEARAQFLVAHPGYFQTMRISMLQGRDFTPEDQSASARVVIVNQSMARRYWPGESSLGRRLTADDVTAHPDWFTVIGVVHDVRQNSWAGDHTPAMYFPSLVGAGYPWNPRPLVTYLNPAAMTLVIRTVADPASLASGTETIVRSMDQDAPVSQVVTIEQAIDQQLAQPRFYLILVGIFAGAALLLSAVGVYGVISYSVARRTREIGLRLALGAPQGEPFRLVVGQGLRLVSLGAGLGLAGALGLTRYLRSLLFEVQPTDPVTFTLVAVLLGLVAVAACWLPARRAARLNPVEALRAE